MLSLQGTQIFPKKSRRGQIPGGIFVQGWIILYLLLEELPTAKSCETDQTDTKQQHSGGFGDS
jgi:hypothetical protein